MITITGYLILKCSEKCDCVKNVGGGAVNMKNFETSIPSIVVYNLIFLSMMVFFTWRISSRFYPYGKKILFMHLLINLIPTFYSLGIGLDSYLDTLIAYVLFLGPTLVLYRHSPLWAMTSYIAMFASQTLSEFLVYLVCALIWNMSTVDVSAAHPMLIYIAYFICGMGSLYGVYRFMLQFTTLEKHLRRLFVVAAFSCFTLLFLIPALVISKSPDFTARLVLVFAVSTIVCLLLYSVHSYITSLRTRKRMELFEREYQMLLEQYRHLDARKEEEIRELHHEIRNCILTLQSLKHGSTHSKEGKES